MKILNKIFLLLAPIALLATPYEDFRAQIKKEEQVPPEIQECRDFHLTTIDRRLKALGKAMETDENKEKIKNIRECVNTKTTKKEIKRCVPSILRKY